MEGSQNPQQGPPPPVDDQEDLFGEDDDDQDMGMGQGEGVTGYSGGGGGGVPLPAVKQEVELTGYSFTKADPEKKGVKEEWAEEGALDFDDLFGDEDEMGDGGALDEGDEFYDDEVMQGEVFDDEQEPGIHSGWYARSPDEELREVDSWEVISAYFKDKGLARQQLESYNDFMNYKMQEIVDQHPPLEIIQKESFQPGQQNRGGVLHKYMFKFGEVSLSKPAEEEGEQETTLLPCEARLRNLTYAAPIYVNISQDVYEVHNYNKDDEYEEHVEGPVNYEKILIGKIPVMLKSDFCWLNGYDSEHLAKLKECTFDQGGYFVINGSEKVLVAQERMANNFVHLFKKKGDSKNTWVCEIRSMPEGRQATTPFSVKLRHSREQQAGGKSKNFGQIVATIPYVRQDIPICVLFRALGVVADRDIVDRIVYDPNDMDMMNLLKASLEDAFSYHDQDKCLDYIGRRGNTMGFQKEQRLEWARGILQRQLLPHIGLEANTGSRKALFVGYMVNRLLLGQLGRMGEDDRDHFGKKRMDTAGPLMSSSFGTLFRKMVKDVKRHLQRNIDAGKSFDLTQAIDLCSTITSGLNYQLATGNWAKDKLGQTIRTGVSQVLNRLTFAAGSSHLRRLNTPLGREGKLAKPRQLHNTHWGLVCPAETPEGQQVGLVKNLALMTHLTVGCEMREVQPFLLDFGLQGLDEVSVQSIGNDTKVFLNGCWVGMTSEPTKLTRDLRDMRRSRRIEPEVGIVRDIAKRELNIFTDQGRACRPLYIVDPGQGPKDPPRLRITKRHSRQLQDEASGYGWENLLDEGLIELIDGEEEETCMIGMFVSEVAENAHYCQTYTHCEIHPAMILGVCASIIPFPDHNQSPRNCYQSAMGKQALGVYVSNFNLRLDTLAHVLSYPQKPLVCTSSMEYLKFRELPAGINCIVAIMCYSGYNQEDSLIMNQASIDRGLFRTTFCRSYPAEEKMQGSRKTEMFDKPDHSDMLAMKAADYSKLDYDGLCEPGQRVMGGDILIGKVNPLDVAEIEQANRIQKKTKRDTSIPMRTSENGVVDEVLLSVNSKGYKFTKVRIRSVRIPQVGDKFASRHGQKGTIGITYRMEDLPFTREGMNPDIIMNPHAIPSRMTIGHLVETLLGKWASLEGKEGDATPFAKPEVTVGEIAKQLHKNGYQKHGNEQLYHGHTGIRIPHKIFIGPTYYQRLKHMVEDKIHARARGPLVAITRQPTEGRAREGGLRFGEMERDCIISHGASKMLRERLFDVSDAYRVHVCGTCGMFAQANLKSYKFECKQCKDKTSIAQVFMPYACKLLFQELMAMQIAPRMVLQPL
uniref:DNA-directed RNA polymerase subunit beta n=1 Tax=Chromera velia CCMP2878 TaxID=1169474 RepID=A0A0G4I541_9ALVE|eukprot:Cvel_11008.t1-p1 / transcript=Cvel_11008.t1 / gene=Cvel_11008 / organism=Chromera_velia_CCMP2878 / gene_product=DNA-directed RNA polymerase II subunit rpb2, putative / transcript_product=DNA-directed RNA polymerase II subunit rpb2, putative / location=Cvel_scaffold678:45316-61599(-) / protein_length=1316 / sequence_SO=supercontig / SO=protein_coding / is_pseudo=false